MAVVNGPITLTGGAGVKPMIKYLLSTDSLATVTSAGYLNEKLLQYGDIQETDLLLIRFDYVIETGAGTNAFFNVAISNGVITLSEDTTNNSVSYTPPSVANHIAVFSNTTGNITDDVATAINGGNIQAGLSGTAGTLASFPATASKGSLKIAAVANTNNDNVTLSNAAHGQATVYSIPDVGAATGQVNVVTGALTSGNLMSASGTAGKLADSGLVANEVLFTSFANPDVNVNSVFFDTNITAAQLASGGTPAIFTSSGTKQYKIREMWINAGGTNFSGGGGDRNFEITDGTTTYSAIPDTTMTTIVNRIWTTDVAFPYPSSPTAINTSTVAGANIVLKYSGGTTDYASGDVTITGFLERVA